MSITLHRKFSIAPMLAMTDRHERYFLRLISKHILLYSEMVTTKALIHADPDRFLSFNQEEHPVALQLGGSEPEELVHGAKLGEKYGFDEINLNLGCPSDKVQTENFGACLMAKPDLVAEGFQKMRDAVSIPVTAKIRIGIDELDSYEYLKRFVQTLADAGCEVFIVHARKAWLHGLNPKQNREIPPLHYEYVYRLKTEFPQLHISINGGITTLDQAEEHLSRVDGVMVGRAAYDNPYFLAEVDQRFFHAATPLKTREEILEEFIPYIEYHIQKGQSLYHFARHIIGLFHGLRGARSWRRIISDFTPIENAGIDVIRKAYDAMALHW